MDIILSLMKYDYLHTRKMKPRGLWWSDQIGKKNERLYTDICQNDNDPKSYKKFDRREWIKNVIIEKIPFNLNEYCKQNKSSSKQVICCFILMEGTCENYWLL